MMPVRWYKGKYYCFYAESDSKQQLEQIIKDEDFPKYIPKRAQRGYEVQFGGLWFTGEKWRAHWDIVGYSPH